MSKRLTSGTKRTGFAPSRKRPRAQSTAAARVRGSGTSSFMAEKRDYRSVDREITDTAIDDNPALNTFHRLNDIAPGDDPVNRDGKRIAYKSVRVRGSVTAGFKPVAGTGLQRDQIFRMVILYTTAPTVAPTWENIFQGTDYANAVIPSVALNIMGQPQATGTIGIWTVLRDEVITVNPRYTGFGSDYAYVAQVPVDMYVNLKGLNANYGNSATDPTLCQGNLWFGIIPHYDDNAVGASLQCRLISRVTFSP